MNIVASPSSTRSMRSRPLTARPPATVSLAWLLAQPTVLSPIASATSADQLAELLACAEMELSPAELQALSDASA